MLYTLQLNFNFSSSRIKSILIHLYNVAYPLSVSNISYVFTLCLYTRKELTIHYIVLNCMCFWNKYRP